MSTKKSILVTGIHRSGSTWVGSVIASNKRVDNIIEPLNPNRIQRFGKFDIDVWNPKLTENSNGPLAEEVLALYKSYRDISYASSLLKLFSSYENHPLFPSLKKRLRRASKPVKLFKDPTALFATPFLVEKMGVVPVILIRHPAAYVLSIKQKNWRFNFNELLKQPHFFEGHLSPYYEEVKRYNTLGEKATMIETGAFAWKIFNAQIAHYKQTYPHWFFITHEALSINPIEEYKKMFRYLDLDFNEDVIRFIEKSTTTSQETKRLRNAVENSKKWQKLLSSTEINTILSISEPIASEFYKN